MGAGDVKQLHAQVHAWIADDPDPATRSEAEHLLKRAQAGDAVAEAQLRDAFGGRLTFGTAGLRAEQGAGPRRLNRVVIAQTSAGLAEYLKQRTARESADEIGSHPTVVIGFDARTNSDVFAREAAEVLAGAGIRVTLFPEPVPTPVTAFAVRHLDASAGVMITASHNPPRDNGYKVYLGGDDAGAQIVSPADRDISAHISRAAQMPFSQFPRSSEFTLADPRVIDAYVAGAADFARAARRRADASDPPSIRVVYTALHGVGAAITRRVLSAAGLPELIPVPEQCDPDGAFPTVEFPNPEEPEALELAFRTARDERAHLVIAHDPDADRLAVAAPDPDSDRGYRRLTGNELGLLLGWRAAEVEHRNAHNEGRAVRGALANTIVSSPALRAVAHVYGLEHVETLSGSKWLARVPELLFGFEEALGYLTAPNLVHDKDGISAAAIILDLVSELHAEGRTVWQRLDEASERFGHFASSQVVVRHTRAADVDALIAWVREHPPARFGEHNITEARDLLRPGTAPIPANVLSYEVEDGSRVMIRPSGTEPKLKVYLDTFCDQGSAEKRRATAAHGLDTLEAAVRDYLAAALKAAGS